MFALVITEKGGAQRRLEFDKPEITIGRVQGNDVILPKGNVSKRHSRIVYKDGRFIVVDLKSTNGTYVNGRKITSPLVVKSGDKIYIGDFIINIEDAGAMPGAGASAPAADAVDPVAAPRPQRPAGPPPLRSEPPPRPAPAPGPPPLPAREPARESVPPPSFALDREPVEEPPPRIAAPAPRVESRPVATAPRPMAAVVQPAVPSVAPQSAPRGAPGGGPAAVSPPQPRAAMPTPAPPRRASAQGLAQPVPAPATTTGRELEAALRDVMGRVASRFDVHLADPASLHDEGRWAAAQAAVQAAIAESEAAGALGARVDRSELTAIALREAVGLGALEPLLTDESVREVVVEGPQRIVADRGEGLQPVAGGFSSSAALLTVARRLFAQAGEALDPSRPIQETALPYGPHVTVVLPPVAVRGPIVEVRRMGQPRSADQLVTSGRLSPAMLETLRAAVAAHRNVVVAGPVGSGVSSLLGALAGLCDPGERIVTIEDIPDVAVAGRDDVVTLVAARGATGLRLRDLLPQASRLRADRIVVDDVTASELFDVLCALVARQPGHFVGFHTSGSGEGIVPLQSALTLGAAAASEHAVADLLARGVHVLVECARCDDGARRVVRVAELVRGRLVDLHLWSGEFRATGARGTFEG